MSFLKKGYFPNLSNWENMTVTCPYLAIKHSSTDHSN